MATRVKKTKTSEAIEALARRAVEKYPVLDYVLPALPKEVLSGEEPLSIPSGVGVLSPAPVALTKTQMLHKFLAPKFVVRGSKKYVAPTPDTVEAVKFLIKQPEALMQYVSDLNYGRLPLGQYGIYFPSDWRTSVLEHYGEAIPKSIGLSASTPPSPYVLAHELGHALSDFWLNKQYRIGLGSRYQGRLVDAIEQLAESFARSQTTPFNVIPRSYDPMVALRFNDALSKSGNPHSALVEVLDQLISANLQ